MSADKLSEKLKKAVTDKAKRTILDPINEVTDQGIKDVSTSIGAFVVRYVQGKFQRSITFTVGVRYADEWMEEALYGILYQYNDIKKCRQLQLTNKKGLNDGSGMYYMLEDGNHNLKYRQFPILLNVTTVTPTSVTGRISVQRIYTIITYDLDPAFVTLFERDMVAHRNALLKIRSDSPTVNVYQDLHESDGYTYWEKISTLHKRRINTIYLPHEQMRRIVDTINNFFANKEYYRKHGIPHNLKILLYGPPGPQPVSIQIPTPNGMRRFGGLSVGDPVFDRTGAITTVKEIQPKGVQDVYEVKFLNGRTTKCTIDHLWKVYYRLNGEWKEDVVPLKYILETSRTIKVDDDTLILSDDRQYSVPENGPAQFYPTQVDVNPYAMGVLITAGCLSENYLQISQPTNEVPTKVASIMGFDVVAKSITGNDDTYIFYDENGKVRTYEIFKSYPDLIGSKSNNREIPWAYLLNSVETRWALLRGLMDGSGSIIGETNMSWTSPLIQFSTTSRKLADQFIWLCRSLGINCREHIKDSDRWLSGDYINITIRIDPDDMPRLFSVSYKRDVAIMAMHRYHDLKDSSNLPWTEYYDRSRIVSVRKLPEQEEVMCIMVDNPEHLYLTEDFIVTHNTGKDSIAKMIASEWNRNLYYVTGGKDGRFVPNAISDSGAAINYPMFLVSDVDKYPYLINEPEITPDADADKEGKLKYKQLFGSMINALDGVLSGEDRIIIMTTNHIEKFSQTILRPGRIDLKEEIGYVTPDVFRRYVYTFYGKELPPDIELSDKELTVAKMQFDVVFMKLTADEFIGKYLATKKKK